MSILKELQGETRHHQEGRGGCRGKDYGGVEVGGGGGRMLVLWPFGIRSSKKRHQRC